MPDAQGLLFTSCEHLQTTAVPEKRGPHYAKLICSKCHKFIRWLPNPETIKRQAENQKILTDLSKKSGLSEWERHFIRSVSSIRNLSPKQQKTLLELRDRHEIKP